VVVVDSIGSCFLAVDDGMELCFEVVVIGLGCSVVK
jgi:hypothetical protein